jgi:hypothetical protein
VARNTIRRYSIILLVFRQRCGAVVLIALTAAALSVNWWSPVTFPISQTSRPATDNVIAIKLGDSGSLLATMKTCNKCFTHNGGRKEYDEALHQDCFDSISSNVIQPI